MRCALLDNMLFQSEMAALLGDSDAGEREGESKRKTEWEREKGVVKKKKKSQGKDGGMEHLLVIQFHIPYGFITIMRERRLQSVWK